MSTSDPKQNAQPAEDDDEPDEWWGLAQEQDSYCGADSNVTGTKGYSVLAALVGIANASTSKVLR